MRRAAIAFCATVLFGVSVRAEEVKKSPSDYALVKALPIAVHPQDACDGTCAQAAAGERDKLGPSPPWPLYRTSPTETKALHDRLVQRDRKKTTRDTVLTREEAIDAWKLSFPNGNYNPNDLADVFAKLWIFSWICGGIDPNAVTEKASAGVRAQAREILAADPAFSALSEAQRQVAAESMIRAQATAYVMMMIVAKKKNGKQDLPAVSGAMNGVRTAFETQYGLDLRKLALTQERGFAQLLR